MAVCARRVAPDLGVSRGGVRELILMRVLLTGATGFAFNGGVAVVAVNEGSALAGLSFDAGAPSLAPFGITK